MAPDDVSHRCVFCLENGQFRPDQILIRDTNFYLCAPLGQLVEGYLVIAPYVCGNSLNRLPSDWFEELDAMFALIEDFYRTEFDCDDAVYYEQGRAGGNARIDSEGAFPFHAHLCGLPVSCDIHGLLGRRYKGVEVNRLSELPAVAVDEAYIYARTGDRQCVYLGRSDEQRSELEQSRLSPQLAELLGMRDQGTWRQNPGSEKMESLLKRFERYRSNR